ncbi:hypothetical protein [Planococcus halotolerans]|uniref:Uncharacterized protein n=1 Tax=Planococcus halotolerans TaxID=2233542 RepID=A0A365KKE4_9BACL|nr:hypothetical protein [Planococcus halotolerans]RAZ73602.1 hypothetical protein DP120_16830 [Planococcus halotolerans]
MAKQVVTIESLEDQLFQLKLEKIIQQAYEQGVRDARTKFHFPHVLKKEHLVEILQVKAPTVDKLVVHPEFPRLGTVKGRYPRDKVFEWIESNTEYVNQYLS